MDKSAVLKQSFVNKMYEQHTSETLAYWEVHGYFQALFDAGVITNSEWFLAKTYNQNAYQNRVGTFTTTG
jgi:hypothetical protein